MTPNTFPAAAASGSNQPPTSSLVPPGIDQSVIAALKTADSKRPALPRHSLGHAGSLAAAAGTLNQQQSLAPGQSPAGHSPASSSGALSPGYPSFGGGGGGGSSQQFFNQQQQQQRRKRAAAAEQGRVMKKLKSKGHIIE